MYRKKDDKTKKKTCVSKKGQSRKQNIKKNYYIHLSTLKQIRYCNETDILYDFRIGRSVSRNITRTRKN